MSVTCFIVTWFSDVFLLHMSVMCVCVTYVVVILVVDMKVRK